MSRWTTWQHYMWQLIVVTTESPNCCWTRGPTPMPGHWYDTKILCNLWTFCHVEIFHVQLNVLGLFFIILLNLNFLYRMASLHCTLPARRTEWKWWSCWSNMEPLSKLLQRYNTHLSQTFISTNVSLNQLMLLIKSSWTVVICLNEPNSYSVNFHLLTEWRFG